MPDKLKEELDYCIKMLEEQGYCSFDDKTQCCNCVALFLLYLIVINKMKNAKKHKLSLKDWQNILINKV